MSQVMHSSAGTFLKDVLESNTPVLVDFYADWCGPCRAISPLLTKMAAEFAGRLKIVKIDVDAESQIALKYQVESIPTLLFIANGQVVQRAEGVLTETKLRGILQQLVSEAAASRLVS